MIKMAEINNVGEANKWWNRLSKESRIEIANEMIDFEEDE